MAAARTDLAGSVSRATGLDPVVAGDAPAIERYDVFAKHFATVAPSGGRRLATATALRTTETLVAGGFDAEDHPSAAAALVRP